MRKSCVVLVGLFFISALAANHAAAFGVSNLSSALGGSDEGISVESAVASQDKLVKTYVGATQHNLQAQAIMAQALGLKEKAAELETQANTLGSGNVDKGEIEKTRELTEAAQEVINENLTEAQALSPEAKILVAKSLLPFATCVLGYKDAASLCGDSLELANKVIQNAPLTQKLSATNQLKKVLYLAPKVPGDLTSVLGTAKKYVDFAKSNDVEIPADAADALGIL